MGDDNGKNINFLPDDLKKKQKSSNKVEDITYEPEMVRPDSEKLKKAKTTDLSGSDVSFGQKLSGFFAKFSNPFNRQKEEEKPRIQELQEMIGKTQHVGEVMINDEEVVPDKERDEVIQEEKEPKESKKKKPEEINIDDSLEGRGEDKVLFVTKEDHEKELQKEKEESVKHIPSPQNIKLENKKDVELPKPEKGIFDMPESLADVSLAGPVEEQLSSIREEGLEQENQVTEKSGPSFWDKIKGFFSGLFAPKPHDISEDKNDEEKKGGLAESVLAYELKKYNKEKDDDKEHVVSTPLNKFSSGVKVMEQDIPKDEKKTERPKLTTEALKIQKEETQQEENIELAAQEDFPETLEKSTEPEDIFSELDEKSQQEEAPTEELPVEDDKPSFWDKIKGFFSGLFASKTKDLNLQEKELKSTEEAPTEEAPIEEESTEEAKKSEKENIELIDQENLATEEVFGEPADSPEIVMPEKEESGAEIEKIEEEVLEVETQAEDKKEDQQLDLPEEVVSEVTEELPVEDDKPSFWDKIKGFFSGLFAPKAKDLNLQEKELKNTEEAPIEEKAESEDFSEPKPVEEDINITTSENVSEEASDLDTGENHQENLEEALDVTIESPKEEQESVVDLPKVEEVSKTEAVPQSEVITEEEELSSRFHQPVESEVENSMTTIDEEGGVDLIPVAVRIKSWIQIAQLMSAAIFGSVIIVLSFYGTLHLQQQRLEKEKAEQDSQITALEEKILEYKDLNQEIQDLGTDLATINDLFNKHIYWTNLFALIEKYTLEDVYFSGFTAGTGGALNFSATGADYETAARQLKLLQSEEAGEFITDVTINAVSLGGGGVNFGVQMILNEELFYYSEE